MVDSRLVMNSSLPINEMLTSGAFIHSRSDTGRGTVVDAPLDEPIYRSSSFRLIDLGQVRYMPAEHRCAHLSKTTTHKTVD